MGGAALDPNPPGIPRLPSGVDGSGMGTGESVRRPGRPFPIEGRTGGAIPPRSCEVGRTVTELGTAIRLWPGPADAQRSVLPPRGHDVTRPSKTETTTCDLSIRKENRVPRTPRTAVGVWMR